MLHAGANLCGPSISTGVVNGVNTLCSPASGGCGHGNVLGAEKTAVQALVDDTYLSADFKMCLLEDITKDIPTDPEIW